MRRWLVVVVGALLLVPLVVSAVWLHANDRWAPLLDIAMTEQRVRDVGTVHTPLIGLPGRLGTTGSHPGPLSFYLLTPLYRALGGSYWALRVSTLGLDALALLSALLVAERRGGRPAVLVTGLLLAFLELGFGLLVLSEPWNPHLPVLWFPVFLLSTWSVVSGDLKLWPVVVASASLCAQTHIPYLAVCGGIGAFALAHLALTSRAANEAMAPPGFRHRHLRNAAVLGLALWAPVALDQLLHRPGNARLLFDYFAHASDPTVGLRSAVELVAARLDPVFLFARPIAAPGAFADPMAVGYANPTRGAIALLLLPASALVARRAHSRSLLALHGVVAAALVVAVIAYARIIGSPWHYLLFSGIVIGQTVWCTLLTTAVVVAQGRLARSSSRDTTGGALCLAAIAALALRLSTRVEDSGSSTPGPSAQLAALVPRVVDALRFGVAGPFGETAPFVLTWMDSLYGGSLGVAMQNELERRGVPAKVSPVYASLVGVHRVLDYPSARTQIHLATDQWIWAAQTNPKAILVAYLDPRSPEQQTEYARTRNTILKALIAKGRPEAAAQFDRDHSAAASAGLGPWMQLTLLRLNGLGVPAAVFVQALKGVPVATRATP